MVLARIDASEGNNRAAEKQFRQLLEEVTDEEQVAEIHYRLWKLSPERMSDHQENAEHLFSNLYAQKPKLEYRKRNT
ncbi:MAG: hypothetical protein AB7H80_10535 [Candidatus Kapaibacterium sp.]